MERDTCSQWAIHGGVVFSRATVYLSCQGHLLNSLIVVKLITLELCSPSQVITFSCIGQKCVRPHSWLQVFTGMTSYSVVQLFLLATVADFVEVFKAQHLVLGQLWYSITSVFSICCPLS